METNAQLNEILEDMKTCPECNDLRGMLPACCQYHLDMQMKLVNDGSD